MLIAACVAQDTHIVRRSSTSLLALSDGSEQRETQNLSAEAFAEAWREYRA